MRFIVFLAVGAIAAGTTATCVACNGGGAGGGTSAGSSGISALRAGTGFGTGSVLAATGSSGMQQALMQQLANQRMLQQQMQQQLMAQQEMLQDANPQPAVTRTDKAQQAREQRLAQRQARAAAIAERQAAAKARNLVKSQVKTPTDGTQIAAVRVSARNAMSEMRIRPSARARFGSARIATSPCNATSTEILNRRNHFIKKL